jgi:alpha-aminoadipic semialdehyde synthase
MMAVDILPASIPLDASQHFSAALVPYLESLIDKYRSGTAGKFGSALERATLAVDGHLSPKHQWLQESVDAFRSSKPEPLATDQDTNTSSVEVTQDGVVIAPMKTLRKKKVLLLGSGMVAGPAVDKIANRGDVQLVIGLISHTSRL